MVLVVQAVALLQEVRVPLPETVPERVGERVGDTVGDREAECVGELLALEERLALLQAEALLVPVPQGEAVARLALAVAEEQAEEVVDWLWLRDAAALALLETLRLELAEPDTLPVGEALKELELEAHTVAVADALKLSVALLLAVPQGQGLREVVCVKLSIEDAVAHAVNELVRLPEGVGVLLAKKIVAEAEGELMTESELLVVDVVDCEGLCVSVWLAVGENVVDGEALLLPRLPPPAPLEALAPPELHAL